MKDILLGIYIGILIVFFQGFRLEYLDTNIALSIILNCILLTYVFTTEKINYKNLTIGLGIGIVVMVITMNILYQRYRKQIRDPNYGG